VRAKMPFATSEWLDGLALSCRPRDNEGSANLTKASDNTIAREAEANDVARLKLTPDSAKLVIILVGLPARGKSRLGHNLERFLSWKGYNTQLFSAGNRRRELANSESGADKRPETASASFFDTKKAYAAMVRENVSLEIFDQALNWLTDESGQVAIFDAANASIQRRAKLQEKAHAAMDGSSHIGVVFLESIVTDPETIQAGMDWKVANSADFRGMDQQRAMEDLLARISHYEKIYETVRAEEGAYIKLFNLSATAHCRNVYGRMARSVLPFLLSMHSTPRTVYMLALPIDEPTYPGAANGDDKDDVAARIAKWAASRTGMNEIRTLTSTLPHAVAAATAFAQAANAAPPAQRPQLAPLRTGNTSDRAMEAESFDAKFGERVANLVGRLEPVALEIEASTQPILIIAHEASVRALRSFLLKPSSSVITERERVDASFEVSRSTLLEFRPSSYGGVEQHVHQL